jgi:hypothetical protein
MKQYMTKTPNNDLMYMGIGPTKRCDKKPQDHTRFIKSITLDGSRLVIDTHLELPTNFSEKFVKIIGADLNELLYATALIQKLNSDQTQ